jgi:signal recognition particle subunit SRP72
VKQGNPYLAQKYFDSLPELTKTERLFEYQDRILRSNRYAVDLAAMKYDGVARSTARILTQTPGPSVSPWNSSVSAIHAAASARCGTDAASLKQLTQLLEKRPDDVGLLLTVVQLHLRNDNVSAAISLLEAFSKRLEEVGSYDEIRFAPGLVALAVQLYRSQGRKAAVGDLLERAAKFWHQKPDAAAGLLKAAGLALLESSDPEGLSMARDIFGDLQQQDSNKPLISAGLVAATSTVDLASARPFLEALTPVNELISGVDVASLEGAGVASLPASLPPAGTKRSAPSDSEKAVKKKIRKSKMPKDYEEGKKMDPERWLPLRDRSSYRPKGKKGKKKALETTQGGVVREEESLELEGGAGAVKVEKAPTGPGKAKKKKGKK